GGRLDVRSAADARTVLHSAVDDGVGDLVLNLSELDSWDATGLGVIMGAHRRAGR
ncbi:STAS domain-containing protein, partial [Streptomyces pseudogriseolus]